MLGKLAVANNSRIQSQVLLGVRRYTRKAALFHLPSNRITESSSPALTTTVAAPIRKLCPAKYSLITWGCSCADSMFQ